MAKNFLAHTGLDRMMDQEVTRFHSMSAYRTERHSKGYMNDCIRLIDLLKIIYK